MPDKGVPMAPAWRAIIRRLATIRCSSALRSSGFSGSKVRPERSTSAFANASQSAGWRSQIAQRKRSNSRSVPSPIKLLKHSRIVMIAATPKVANAENRTGREMTIGTGPGHAITAASGKEMATRNVVCDMTVLRKRTLSG